MKAITFLRLGTALISGLITSQGANQVFFGNLHSHTSYSDGVQTPNEAYAHARDIARIDFLAITEHNHLTGANRIASNTNLYAGDAANSLKSTANRFTEDGRFVAIYGQEFSSIDSGNHANVLEVNEVIQTSAVPNGEWDDLINSWLPAHADSMNEPAILLLNHPANSGSPNSREYGIDDYPNIEAWRAALDRHVHLINIINGPSHTPGDPPGEPSEGEFLRYLNLGLHISPTADQDNHKPNWGDAAETRTGVIAPSLTKSNILTALRNRRTYATQDRNLKIIGTVNGEPMGTRFKGSQVPAPNTPLTISLSIEDLDEPDALYTAHVFSDAVGGSAVADAGLATHFQGNGSHNLAGIRYTGGDQYFFVRIAQYDDDHVQTNFAWLAPVWFEPGAAPAAVIAPVLSLQVDVVAETAMIQNSGNGPANLRNYTLVSLHGNQRFRFQNNLNLQPGRSVVITSGPGSVEAPSAQPPKIRWSLSQIWRNSGDPGRLLDPNEEIVAEDP